MNKKVYFYSIIMLICATTIGFMLYIGEPSNGYSLMAYLLCACGFILFSTLNYLEITRERDTGDSRW